MLETVYDMGLWCILASTARLNIVSGALIIGLYHMGGHEGWVKELMGMYNHHSTIQTG
jgi:hypothetical protein